MGGAFDSSILFAVSAKIGTDSILDTFWNGSIDDMRTYNRALSASEIKSLYAQGVPNKQNTSSSPGGLASGLVGHWTFDGKHTNWGTGTVTDASGNANSGRMIGTISTSTAPTAGKIGQGLKFDGINDALYAPLNLSNTNVVSVSWWMNWNAYAADDDLAYEFTSNINVVQGGFLVDPNDSTSGNFALGLRGNVGYSTVNYTRPSANTLHHYVAIFDMSQSTNEINLYINGILQTAVVRPFNSNNTSNFKDDTLYLMSRAGLTLFGRGSLDDFRVYNRALSAEEIKTLYRMGR